MVEAGENPGCSAEIQSFSDRATVVAITGCTFRAELLARLSHSLHSGGLLA